MKKISMIFLLLPPVLMYFILMNIKNSFVEFLIFGAYIVVTIGFVLYGIFRPFKPWLLFVSLVFPSVVAFIFENPSFNDVQYNYAIIVLLTYAMPYMLITTSIVAADFLVKYHKENSQQAIL